MKQTKLRISSYTAGILGIVWFIAWMILVSDTPAQHPRIQDTERRYIETTIGANKKEDTNVRDVFIIYMIFL